MELDLETCFAAARDGNIQTLRDHIGSRKSDDLKVKSFISHRFGEGKGATPLVIAARNGHLEVVQFLIEQCGTDVESVGSVVLDNSTAGGAPPLWCAAAAGHLDIVKFLINNAADVNKGTETNSTPLRTACFDGHLDIVKYLVEHNADIEIANKDGHTCLMAACYKGHLRVVKYLLEAGVDVNRKIVSPPVDKGTTALHYCAQHGSIEIMKLLLEHNAKMERNSRGETPIVAAAIFGHAELVEYLIQREEILRVDAIEVLELLGATSVDKKEDFVGAIKCWKRAFELRNFDPQNPTNKPAAPSTVPAYGGAVEIQSVEQLVEIAFNDEKLKIQSLLIRERILGPAHPATHHYLRLSGEAYAEVGDSDRGMALLLYSLELGINLHPLSYSMSTTLVSLTQLINFMMIEDQERSAFSRSVKFADICSVFGKAISELSRGKSVVMNTETPPSDSDTANYSRLMKIILHLMSMMCPLSFRMSKEEKQQLKSLVFQLVQMEPRDSNGQTLLELASSRETTKIDETLLRKFPCLNCMRLLKEAESSLSG